MKAYAWLTIGLLVIGPLSAAAVQHPSASVPSGDSAPPLARHWQGLAQETPGIYLGPVKANVPLHPRETLRLRDDTLYTVAMEPMPVGRDTTTTITLHPAAR